MDWLHEMLGRIVKGVPPVTVAEFEELTAWFHANEDRLRERSRPSGLLDWATDGIQRGAVRGQRGGEVGTGRGAEGVRELWE